MLGRAAQSETHGAMRSGQILGQRVRREQLGHASLQKLPLEECAVLQELDGQRVAPRCQILRQGGQTAHQEDTRFRESAFESQIRISSNE